MDIDEFVTTYTPEVRDLTEELRAFVIEQVPEATEELHVGWRVISYGTESKFCAIAPHGDWVNLQFHKGSGLADPKGLLEGTGKSMRHVKIRDSAAISDDLAALLKAACAF